MLKTFVDLVRFKVKALLYFSMFFAYIYTRDYVFPYHIALKAWYEAAENPMPEVKELNILWTILQVALIIQHYFWTGLMIRGIHLRFFCSK